MKTLMNKSNICVPFADIHTHILNSIDDGSSSVDESLELLKREKAQGATRVVLTPHFDLDCMTVENFLKEREEKFAMLLKAAREEPELKGLTLHLGAEVKYTPNLLKADVESLKIEGTNCILLELPAIEPFYLDETLNFLLEKKIVPIFAHIERCSFLYSIRNLFYYKNKGVIMQSNLSALLERSTRSFSVKMIKRGYIDILASDCHNTTTRKPVWDEAAKVLKPSQFERLKDNSLKLFFSGKNGETL